MNLAIIPFTALPFGLYLADKVWGTRRATATKSAEGGFSALGNRQDGVNLAAKPH
jgi:hypothetical protein